jgi:PAS domain S-box-containing protein
LTQESGWKKETAMLEKLSEENPNPFLRISKDCAILYANRASYPVLETWRIQVGQSLPEECCKLAKEALNSGKASTFEFNCDDGRLFMVTLAPVVEKGCVDAYGVDITECKKVEKALRESEQKWRSLAENAPDVILTIDPDGTILFLNRTVPPFTPEKAVGTSVYEYVPPDYQQTLRDALEQVVRTGEPCSYEVAGCGPDGRTSWYQSRMGPIKKDGRVVAMTLIAADVTEHRQAIDALRKSENKYRTLLENLPQKIFLKDRNSVYVSCNENFVKDFNIKAEEITGKNDYDIVPRDLAEKYRADDKRIIESGETKDFEERYIQQGQETIVHTVKTPVKDEQGNVIGILGIFWDITGQKRIEQRDNEHRAELARASRLSLVGEMASGLAHELNQPLCAIASYTQGSLRMMESGAWDSNELLDAMRDVAAQAERAGQIIHRMAKLVRQKEPHKSSVNIKDIIQETVSFVDSEAKIRGITIERVEPSEEMPLVTVDSLGIEQVLLNLLQNAFEAISDMHDGKRQVTIRVSRDTNDAVEVTVSDTGKGLPMENIDIVFQPFFTTKSKGLGIGLSISRSIVEAHGGHLVAELNPAGGALFRFTLPLKGNVHV